MARNLPRNHDRKRSGALPPALPAADALSLAGQMEQLLQGFTATRQQIMQSSGDLKQQNEIALADIENQGNTALAQTENAALARGAAMGSEDVSARIAVQGATQAALRDAGNALAQGLSANKNALATAQRDYATGSAAVDAAMNGPAGGALLDSGAKSGGGGGRGGRQPDPGTPASAYSQLSPADQALIKAFATTPVNDYTPEMGRAVMAFINADAKGAEEYFTRIWGNAIPPAIMQMLKDAKERKIRKALMGYF